MSSNSGDQNDPSDEDTGKRRPVTLRFSGPPLRLPGAEAEESNGPASSAGAHQAEVRQPNAEEGDKALDAWTVDRYQRRSTAPPPPLPSSAELPAAVTVPRGSQASGPGVPADEMPPGGGHALDLIERPRPSAPAPQLVNEIADRYALGDFSGALRTAELLLGREPDNAMAADYATSCKRQLEQLYSSRLGNRDCVPEVTVPDAEIRWLGLDHRAGFLLSRVDGRHSVAKLIEVSSMSKLEVLKTLSELLSAGVIRMNRPGRNAS